VNDTSDTVDDTLASGAVALDSANFAATVLVDGLVAMVEFYSPLCYSCNLMEPVVDSLADRFLGTALVAKVNVDEQDSLQAAYGVTSWPAFLFFSDGVPYDRIVGVVSQDSLAAVITRGLNGEI